MLVEPCKWSVLRVEPTIDNPQDQLSRHLASKLAEVNALIQARMASENAPRITQVTEHLVGSGGKRLRPMLTLAAAELCGYRGSHDVRLATTVEFIHTATLLHDDVVDESRQRRGRPTANLLWDNKSSVLVGDYLFARSFQLMVETNSLQVLDILATASAQIAEGEVLQLTAAKDLSTTEATYLKVVRGKTAALFAAATAVGGVISAAPQAQTDALSTYGDALGITFQIIDDLLDFQGDPAQTGKNIGDDFRERKLTLPMIKAIAASDQQQRSFWNRTIRQGQQQEGDLEHAIDLMTKHHAFEAARKDAREYSEKARSALRVLPEHPLRQMLSDLVGYVLTRLI